jgi:hypothetical protein
VRAISFEPRLIRGQSGNDGLFNAQPNGSATHDKLLYDFIVQNCNSDESISSVFVLDFEDLKCSSIAASIGALNPLPSTCINVLLGVICLEQKLDAGDANLVNSIKDISNYCTGDTSSYSNV